jgi:hypothetical protein
MKSARRPGSPRNEKSPLLAPRMSLLLGSKKPYLLTSVKNNLGAETKIEYAPSTKFYLEDLKNGTPWATRLPFPVHVLARVETHEPTGPHLACRKSC